MVQAANFGNGQTQLWALQNKWRSDVTRYGHLCEQLGAAACWELALDLYTHAAEIELRLQQLEET